MELITSKRRVDNVVYRRLVGGKMCCGGTSVSWYMSLTCGGGESTDDESLFGLSCGGEGSLGNESGIGEIMISRTFCRKAVSVSMMWYRIVWRRRAFMNSQFSLFSVCFTWRNSDWYCANICSISIICVQSVDTWDILLVTNRVDAMEWFESGVVLQLSCW